MSESREVFVTGSTGFMGRALIALLVKRGHHVRALVRAGSERKAPPDCKIVIGDPRDATTFATSVSGADTFVQLVGVTHPNPSKGEQFHTIDLNAALAGLSAARDADIKHFIYVSVAHPAPIMKSYIAVRMEAEQRIRESGLNATFLRPWYVLGPGRWWPYFLVPMYWLFGIIPSTRESAQRLGLVTREQMIDALAWSVENPANGVRVMEVPAIRTARLTN
jgi:uncharacterized protein YbjT (DUF2867 family)